jgi:DNA topoisomerase-1
MAIPYEQHEPESIIRNSKLIYIRPGTKGYQREKKKGEFIYLDLNGKTIRSAAIINRIKNLVIPPAWKEVWICPSENGHIQATGLDTKGRKQYRYHNLWKKLRNETKFDRLYFFGKKLGKLRKQLKKDLRRRNLDKEKVTALALSIMEHTLIRSGNSEYEKENGSYGLTTLKNRHVRFRNGGVLFKFTGKKGISSQIKLKAKSLVRLLKRVKELPGQELFQYYDNDRNLNVLNSADINNYLTEFMDESFTCKDFRTWAGCVCAIEYMLKEDKENGGKENNPAALVDQVANRLGNTRAVCRKYYIHPTLLDRYEAGTLDEIRSPGLANPEKILRSFLKKQLKPSPKHAPA